MISNIVMDFVYVGMGERIILIKKKKKKELLLALVPKVDEG